MASSSVSVETSDLTILHPNIKLVINKSELCPICLGDFVSIKNIRKHGNTKLTQFIY